jgi:hypothetical protein
MGRHITDEMSSLMKALTTISGYLVAFYLYFFLAVLLYDLFLLINLKTKFLLPETRRKSSFRLYTLSAMIVLSMAVVIGGAINLNTIRVSEYKVDIPRNNSAIDHLRIAFVADFHLQQEVSINYVEQFVRKVNALQPDILLYGGDIVESYRKDGTTDTIEARLKAIHPTYGAYGVIGNHEIYGGQQLSTFFEKSGITLLLDTVVTIGNSFYLAGRMDEHIRNRKTVDALLGNIIHDLPIILMDHRPTELQQVSQTAVDVQFSGHTHNGQLFPLNYIIHNLYELSWGYRKIKNTHFFVTSGLRLWGPPIKTAGKSEIMIVDIKFK